LLEYRPLPVTISRIFCTVEPLALLARLWDFIFQKISFCPQRLFSFCVRAHTCGVIRRTKRKRRSSTHGD
jgi:hypothetical protein